MSDLHAYITGFAAGATALAFGLVMGGFEVIHADDRELTDLEELELGGRLIVEMDAEVDRQFDRHNKRDAPW